MTGRHLGDLSGGRGCQICRLVSPACQEEPDEARVSRLSTEAAKNVRKTIREWRMASTRNNQTLEDLAQLVNPVVRGWTNYYGRFYRSRWKLVLRHLNRALVAWACRKYRRFRRRERAAIHWLGRIARRDPNLFAHWQLGVRPPAGTCRRRARGEARAPRGRRRARRRARRGASACPDGTFARRARGWAPRPPRQPALRYVSEGAPRTRQGPPGRSTQDTRVYENGRAR